MAYAPYHHGDLHAALLREAHTMLREQGLEALTLRRLAERAGVSRSALYHHFRDKNDLLCSLAARGFERLEKLLEGADLQPDERLPGELRRFVHAYIRFATEDPEQYDLMFGRTLWQAGQPTDELRAVAYRVFRHYARNMAELEPLLTLPGQQSMLRLAQVSWATLHGLCRLLIDGIYPDPGGVEDISEQALAVMLASINIDG